MASARMIILIFALSTVSQAQEVWKQQAQEQNLPAWARVVFQRKGLHQDLSVSYDINPFYLRGDFNGDKKDDIAVLMEKKSTSERGIAVIHSNDSSVHILGAGNKIGNGGIDFRWMNVWGVFPQSVVSLGAGEVTVPSLIGEAIHVVKFGSASGLIYWNGKKYDWYQQGD